MSKIQEIKSYTPPILHTGKDWYIDFYAFNPVDGVMKRKKIKLNFIKSVKERRAYAKGCINRLSEKRLSGNFWLLSFKISYLCLPLFYETRTTPSCHPSGCAYRQL